MAQVTKSLVYLASFTAVGYVLMKLTEPSPEKLNQLNRYKDPETRKRTELILQKLKEASERKDPVYNTQNNKEVSQENPSQKQPSKREII